MGRATPTSRAGHGGPVRYRSEPTGGESRRRGCALPTTHAARGSGRAAAARPSTAGLVTRAGADTTTASRRRSPRGPGAVRPGPPAPAFHLSTPPPANLSPPGRRYDTRPPALPPTPSRETASPASRPASRPDAPRAPPRDCTASRLRRCGPLCGGGSVRSAAGGSVRRAWSSGRAGAGGSRAEGRAAGPAALGNRLYC